MILKYLKYYEDPILMTEIETLLLIFHKDHFTTASDLLNINYLCLLRNHDEMDCIWY